MPLERRRLTDEIALALQQRIAELELQEGDKMPSHAALAESLSISVPSLREGMQVLAALGIVRLEHGRGTIVGRPSIAEYFRSVDPSLLARGYSFDESVSVLTTTLNSLVEELLAVHRREPSPEAAIESLRSAADAHTASAAVRKFYAALVAPLKRPLTEDIIDLTVRLVLAAPRVAESILERSFELSQSFARLVSAVDRGDAAESYRLLAGQKELLGNLFPGTHTMHCASGSIGGTFYSAGLELATTVRDLSGLLLRVRPSAGGIENLQRLSKGQVEIAFTQAHVARAAYLGEEPFGVPIRDLTAICRTHSLDLWIVTAKASGITDLRSLPGKRVSMGTRGGETSRISQELLNAYGHEGSTIEQRYLSISQAAEALSRGEIDVLFYLTGGMGTALSRLAETHELRLLGIDEEILDALSGSDASWGPSRVGFDDGARLVPTLRVETLLVTRASLPEEQARAIWRAAELAGKSSAILWPAIPPAGDPLPLHPGVLHA